MCVGMCWCACVCVHVWVCMCVGVHVWVCMCVCACVGVHVWVCMCGCACVGVAYAQLLVDSFVGCFDTQTWSNLNVCPKLVWSVGGAVWGCRYQMEPQWL